MKSRKWWKVEGEEGWGVVEMAEEHKEMYYTLLSNACEDHVHSIDNNHNGGNASDHSFDSFDNVAALIKRITVNGR